MDTKKNELEKNAMEYSVASTQCSSVLSSLSLQSQRISIQESSTIVGLVRAILKTISHYCKVCKTIIMREKNPFVLLAEYSTKVLIYINLLVEWVLSFND